MEAKSKPSPGGPRKQADKTAKREVTTPRKTNAAPIAPPRRSNPTPSAPPPEAAPPIAVPAAERPAMDNAEMQNHNLPTEVAKAEEAKQDCRDCLMPFLIGGAVVAAAAILVGAFLVARRN